jgi:hypothetical protein
MSKSVMTSSHNFATMPTADIQRSTFDRSHGLKTTFDADYLVPIFLDEVLPGDTFNLTGNLFGRLATPINPIMDNLFLDTFYFFVPARLVWSNFKKFMGEQTDPGDSIDYTIPSRAEATGYSTGSLQDYFGLPISTPVEFNTLPLRAYNLIYNEWFRDQNLQDSVEVRLTDSGDLNADWTLLKRGKRHDYFTSCLPWTQKGDPVTLPLTGTVDVESGASEGAYIGIYAANGAIEDHRLLDANAANVDISATGGTTAENNKMYVDLANAAGSTVNTWRQSFQIQKFLEKDASGGTRYIEKVLSHFGVRSSDARHQRPEYLGGGSQPININPVPQTGETNTTPQGNMSAFGTVSGRSGFTKSFEEHGYIIGLANVRADITYQQGLNKLWSRSTQYDFYFPTFAHLGEQAVLNQEIYAQGTSADTDTFGYQERFAEYRYKPSQITGLFRSTATSSLDPWHLSEEFTSLPTLSSTFIESNTPLDRAIAVTTEPHIILDAYFQLKCTRPMPVYSPPGLIDHF